MRRTTELTLMLTMSSISLSEHRWKSSGYVYDLPALLTEVNAWHQYMSIWKRGFSMVQSIDQDPSPGP